MFDLMFFFFNFFSCPYFYFPCFPPFCLNRTIRTKCFRYLFSSLISFVSSQSHYRMCTKWDWEILCSLYHPSNPLCLLWYVWYDVFNVCTKFYNPLCSAQALLSEFSSLRYQLQQCRWLYTSMCFWLDCRGFIIAYCYKLKNGSLGILL